MGFVKAGFVKAGLTAAALAFCAPGGAAEPETLARIGAQIGQHPVVRADFTQTRQMAVMKRPLVTSGRLVYTRQQGVLWQIDQPYRMTYVLGEERILEISADGTRRERRLRDVPGMAQVGRVLRALFGADTAVLQEQFDVSLRGDAANWQLDLKPRQAQLAQFITAVQVSGGRFVDAIRMDEAGGDTTQIRFRNSQSATAPDAAESQLLGPAKP